MWDELHKNKLIAIMPVVSITIVDYCYHGLCVVSASVSAIPFTIYQEIMHDIAPLEVEDIDVTIKLVNGDTIS